MEKLTVAKYFKDKINWKVYNRILDICTVLDDNDVSFNICIQVRQGVFRPKYHTLYDCGEFVGNDDDNNYDVYAYELYYKDYGLFYTLMIYNSNGKFEDIYYKIMKKKGMKVVDDKLVYNCYLLRFKYEE